MNERCGDQCEKKWNTSGSCLVQFVGHHQGQVTWSTLTQLPDGPGSAVNHDGFLQSELTATATDGQTDRCTECPYQL